ncbi:hypothetical protein VCAG7404_001472, partial [Vibrio cholerae O1 str. AG-7404]
IQDKEHVGQVSDFSSGSGGI